MHQTVMDTLRPFFLCDVPLSLCGDAEEYAAYVLNIMPIRYNHMQVSPVKMLTGQATSLVDIVVFGSRFEVYRDPNWNSLKQHSKQGVIKSRKYEKKEFAYGCRVTAL